MGDMSMKDKIIVYQLHFKNNINLKHKNYLGTMYSQGLDKLSYYANFIRFNSPFSTNRSNFHHIQDSNNYYV